VNVVNPPQSQHIGGLDDGVGVTEDVNVGVGVTVLVSVGVGVAVGVGVQHMQLAKLPIKFQIGGALHWHTSLNPVIIKPLAQEMVSEAVHLLTQELAPVYLTLGSQVIVELYVSPHGNVPLIVQVFKPVLTYVTGMVKLLQEASNWRYVFPSHSQQVTLDGVGVTVGVAVVVTEGVIDGVVV
jgi:hypothetical protein